MARRRQRLNLTWRETWPIWASFTILAVIGALVLWLFVPAVPPIRVLNKGEDVALLASSLEPNQPVLFSFPSASNQSIEFFAERQSGDQVVVAFASCRRCYHAGHYLQGGQILCRKCNQPMERLAQGQLPGPEQDCKHVPIPFESSAGHIVVRAQAVADAFARWYAPAVASKSAGSGR